MAGRRLTAEEQAIWQRVAQSVRPLAGHRRAQSAAISVVEEETPFVSATKPTPVTDPQHAMAMRAVRRPSDYLDNGWEKRIATGALHPDVMIDLHGHTLDAAHRRLSSALAAAVARRDRVMLVVTGKPRPVPAHGGERVRGAIRAEIGHWLSSSPHADAIASVRAAHPRHGGAGALYIILRRR